MWQGVRSRTDTGESLVTGRWLMAKLRAHESTGRRLGKHFGVGKGQKLNIVKID
jgi:hypothetical protein